MNTIISPTLELESCQTIAYRVSAWPVNYSRAEGMVFCVDLSGKRHNREKGLGTRPWPLHMIEVSIMTLGSIKSAYMYGNRSDEKCRI